MAFTTDYISAASLIKTGLANRLELFLISQVEDSSKAGLVRKGRLQADPTDKNINILVRQGGKEWPDKLDTEGMGAGKGAEQAYALGGNFGSKFYRRRTRVEFQLFFDNDRDRDMSQELADLVMARAMHAIDTWNPRNDIVPDSFGEAVWDVQVPQNYLEEGGGTGAFNWRGYMVVEFLTEIEPPND